MSRRSSRACVVAGKQTCSGVTGTVRVRQISWRLLFFSQMRALFAAVGQGGKGLRSQQCLDGLAQGGGLSLRVQR